MSSADTVAAQDVDHEAEAARLAAEATVAAQDVNPNAVPERGAAQNNKGEECQPNDIIAERYNTTRHLNYENAVRKCKPEGVTADTCSTGYGKGRCQWGIPRVLGLLNPAIVAKSQAIARCKEKEAADKQHGRIHRHTQSRC
jgi:hypothetical protein